MCTTTGMWKKVAQFNPEVAIKKELDEMKIREGYVAQLESRRDEKKWKMARDVHCSRRGALGERDMTAKALIKL